MHAMNSKLNNTRPPQAIGPRTVSGDWVDRITYLVAELRNDWDKAGIRAVLRKVADRPLGVVAIAAVTAATTRPDQRTPAVIAMDGPHWHTASGGQPASTPGIVTWCEHGRPTGLHCYECAAPVHARPPTPEQRATIRAGIAAAKAETARRENRR